MSDTNNRSWWRWICFLAAIAALIVSIQLVALDLAGPQQSPEWLQRLCGAVPGTSCHAVLRSPWGRIGNLPSAAWGAAYFALLTCWYLFAGRPDHLLRRWQLGVNAITLIGCLSSANFIWVMLTQLPAWCLLCMFCHVMNAILIFGGGVLWLRARSSTAVEMPPANHKFAIAVLALGSAAGLLVLRTTQLGVVAGSAAQFRNAYLGVVSDHEYVRWHWQSSPPLDVTPRADDPVRGSADAPHTAVVFSDFECPQCARLAGVLDAVLKELPDQLCVVFKYLPLDQTCNQRITPQQSIYPAGCQAARAAEAAMLIAGPKVFWKMHDAMMKNQHLVRRRAFGRLAEMAGLNAAQLLQKMNDPVVDAGVAQDIEDAPAVAPEGAGGKPVIPGTPLLVLDGRDLQHWAVFISRRGGTQLDMARTIDLWRMLLADATAKSAP
jgi:uncharacterized membrane protein